MDQNEQKLLNEAIFEKLSLVDAPEEIKQSVLSNIASIVQKRALRLIRELTTDEQEEQLGELAAQGDPQKMQAWISENVVDLEEIFNGLLNEYVDELALKYKKV